MKSNIKQFSQIVYMNDLTPAMKQFVKVKREYPTSLLLFRMGDFYETFFDDAKVASKVLNITLTKRGTQGVPLAGIPYHALDNYLAKLIKAGYTVTIVEQMEDPKLAKGRLVKRDVLRTITPGTVLNGDFLDSKTNNYIVSLCLSEKIGLTISDISTGEFKVTELNDLEELIHELIKIQPAEIILPDNTSDNTINRIKKVTNSAISPFSFVFFNKDFGLEELKNHFNVLSLDGFEISNKDLIIASAGALLYYFRITQKSKINHIKTIKKYSIHEFMYLDSQTVQNLELIENNFDRTRKHTLLEVLDNTNTSMGARMLKREILKPLLNKHKIDTRLNKIETIINSQLFYDLADILKQIPDIERILSKIAMNTANARDLIGLKNAIFVLPQLKSFCEKIENFDFELNQDILDIGKLIDTSIVNEPPMLLRDGGIIKRGFNQIIDELKDIKENISDKILAIEKSEREKTSIKGLKVKYNKVFGYFIEVPKLNEKVPENYIRKQTLVNAERYITEELKLLEDTYLSSEEKAKTLEYDLFQKIVEEINLKIVELYNIAKGIEEIDFFNSMAITAIKNNYLKPTISENYNLEIINGRHPVIEKIEENDFIKNNLFLDKSEQNIMILTGPNMAGKSTYLRQNALIILMAQMGSFVPAEKANIGLVDRIFTRIGARDNLAMGQSTFMVEMNEVANILNNATERSFVILDEVGRGTSTFDGLSIAWSVVEYIFEKIKAKTLFATHYYQITELEEKFAGIKNYHISVKEHNGEIIFLRKILRGSIDKSYGIEVAKLAGIPKQVIERAKVIESQMELNINKKETPEEITIKKLTGQKTLF